MDKHYNIYGFDMNKIYEVMYGESKERQEQWAKEGRCWLCGGDHSKDMLRSAYLDCPHCGERGEYMVAPNCPGGVSHGETHSCPKCNKEVFIVVYYDGDCIISER